MFALGKFERDLPELLIVGEAPHGHLQYLFYEIFCFFSVTVLKFVFIGIGPGIFLKDVFSGDIVESKDIVDDSGATTKEAVAIIQSYYRNARVACSKDYRPTHLDALMKRISSSTQNDSWIKYLYLVTRGMVSGLLGSLRKGGGDYIHVQKTAARYFLKSSRRKSLQSEHDKFAEDVDLSRTYVYFSLHYEPERTNNPDGGVFHDMLIALTKLRSMLPDNMHIYVKEHPLQLSKLRPGHRGRSPLFYKALTAVQGVSLACKKTLSLDLIDNAIFISTITGTTAIESAMRGKKSLIFGDAWYKGCPNVFHIDYVNSNGIESMLSEHVSCPCHVQNWIDHFFLNFCVPGIQNPGAENRYRSEFLEHLANEEARNLSAIVEKYFLINSKGTTG